MKRLILLILLLPIVYADGFSTIPDINISTGNNLNVVNLDNYFNGTDYFFKHKEGNKGLDGINITIGSKNTVNIFANSAGEYSAVFIADNDTDLFESNDINIKAAGDTVVQNTTSNSKDFFPAGSSITLKIGGKQNFAVSGENTSAEWYLDGLMLPETSGQFVFDAIIIGSNELKVISDGQTKAWSIIVEAEEAIEELAAPIEIEKIRECGNNIKESGENCENCPSDVRCSEESVCKNSICVKDESSNMAIIWFGLFGFIIVGLVIGVIFAAKKGYLNNINFNFFKNILNKFSKKENPKKEIIQEVKTEEAKKDLSQLKNYLIGNLKNGFKKEELVNAALQQGWKQEEIDEVLQVKENLKPLYDYIQNSLKNGFKKEELVNAALQQGWKQEEIDETLVIIELVR